jgi:hypothetical protein
LLGLKIDSQLMSTLLQQEENAASEMIQNALKRVFLKD